MSFSEPTGGEPQSNDGGRPGRLEKVALSVFHDLQLTYVRKHGRAPIQCPIPPRPSSDAHNTDAQNTDGRTARREEAPSVPPEDASKRESNRPEKNRPENDEEARAALSVSESHLDGGMDDAPSMDDATSENSSSDSNSASPLINFEGPWTEPEKEQVTPAVSKITRLLPSHLRTAPWIATCHRSDSADMYAISRAGLPEVLAARTAGALAEKLQALDADLVRSAAQQASSTGRSDSE
ncbi:hypothetical protein [Salinibacter sp. 10B]|uniref:hypothetical protein n=1 Tax=Salinibacter sp. 10B TaxID=1923971 RepID=UPI0011AFD61E|nr:hypothetical protein [Salinibacter sp. 10B]